MNNAQMLLFDEIGMSVGLTTCAFLLFWWLTHFAHLDTTLGDNSRQLYAMRLTGAACFVVAATVYLIFFEHPWPHAGWQLKLHPVFWLLLFPVIVLSFQASRRTQNLAQYPQLRKMHWDNSDFVKSAITWFLYLTAYEWLFRGILLPACLAGGLSLVSAVVLNTALYSLVHVPKGQTEVWAAIPFGIVVCWLTVATKSIWPALLLHLALAWTNEWSSWYFHPDMRRSTS